MSEMRTSRNLRIASAVTSCVILLGSAVPAPAQSLGDVARREAERRKQGAGTVARVYTNEDLSAVDVPTSIQPLAESAPVPAAADAATRAAKNGRTVVEEDPATETVNIRTTTPAREKRSEAYWRVSAKELRERLVKASSDLEAAQSGLAALDAGPQTPATTRERAIVASTVQRLQTDVYYRQQDLTRLKMQAEFNKIPAEWIQ